MSPPTVIAVQIVVAVTWSAGQDRRPFSQYLTRLQGWKWPAIGFFKFILQPRDRIWLVPSWCLRLFLPSLMTCKEIFYTHININTLIPLPVVFFSSNITRTNSFSSCTIMRFTFVSWFYFLMNIKWWPTVHCTCDGHVKDNFSYWSVTTLSESECLQQ